MPKSITAANIFSIFGISTTAGCFDFRASRNGTSNILTWTWPVNMKEGLLAGAPTFSHLTVQRSTVASNSPTAGVAYGVSGVVPVFDPNWSDIKQWQASNWIPEGAPDTYTDPWDSQTPVCYRLILNTASPRVEMDWIPALIVPAQTSFQAATSGQPRLTWDAPDVSWFPVPGTVCP